MVKEQKNQKVKQLFNLNKMNTVKKQFEFETMFCLGQNMIKKIQNKMFPKPALFHLRSFQVEKTSESLSTTDSDSSINEDESISQKNYHELIGEKVSKNEPKIQSILKFFSNFEKQILEVISAKKFEIFTRELFINLGRTIEKSSIYQLFDSESLSVSILMLTCIKIGLKQNQCWISINRIAKKNYQKASSIKRLVCYRKLKKFLIFP